MARQAHQAELQARAVAGNLVAELSGRPARHRFRSELACIVDSLDQGMLIYRSRRLALRLPRMKLLHWLKKRLERHHLQRYRRRSPDPARAAACTVRHSVYAPWAVAAGRGD